MRIGCRHASMRCWRYAMHVLGTRRSPAGPTGAAKPVCGQWTRAAAEGFPSRFALRHRRRTKPGEIAVSDRTTLRGLTQFHRRAIAWCPQAAEYKWNGRSLRLEGGFCASLFEAARKSLNLNGEMSEWLKEHAWKACVGETLPWVRIPLSPPSPFARLAADRATSSS